MTARIVIGGRGKFHLRSDNENGELILEGNTRKAYAWAQDDVGKVLLVFTGRQALRKLADAIYELTGAEHE